MFRFQRRRDLQLRSWQGVEDRSEVQGLGKPSRVYCLRSFLPKEQVAELREYLRSSEDYETSSDSVDEAPTFEFYPCARGRWRDSVLERLLGPAAEELQQLLKQRLGAGALSEVLVRRYLPSERRGHGLHYDGHAFVTAVLGVSEVEDFRGGLFLQSEAHLRSRRYVELKPGDLLVHSFDLQHGVEVLEGCRYSLIFWFKDSEESVLASTTPWYDELAEAEDVHALYNLGVQHELGVSGKEQDLDLARQFYRRSAEQGHPFAQNNLALLCEEPEAGQWLRRAAAQGHATAQMNLAAQVPEAEAVVWMRRAAEQLDPKAAYCLGEMYQRGYGMAPDLSEARRWYRHSADRGHFPSLTQLGLLSFEEGNFEEARGLFEAASLGDSEAFRHLVAARALLGEKPLDIWQELADEGQPEALFQLGMSYLNGEGVSVDEEKAFRLLQTAAELGHSDAAECVWYLEQEEEDGEYAPALDGTSVGPRAL